MPMKYPTPEEIEENHKSLLEDVYKGDKEALKADTRAGRRERITWDQLVTNATVLPQHREAAFRLIDYCLGFVVPETVTAPHMPFLQQLVEAGNNGMPMSELEHEAVRHIKMIRNDYMKAMGLLKTTEMTHQQVANYEFTLPLYKETARSRLAKFLGYEPELEYSFDCEMALRKLFASGDFEDADTPSDIDIEIMTVIKYREAYFSKGESVANELPLLGC